MLRSIRAPLCVVAAAILGAACTVARPPAAVWVPPVSDTWVLDGRLAVSAGGEGWHAAIHWRQSGGGFRIRLSGPLGQGALELVGGADGVRLSTADGREALADTPEQLLARQTGWRLPVSGLRYWVRGESMPGEPAVFERDAQGRPRSLRQAGWTIDYLAYRPAGTGELPARLRLVAGGVLVKLVIDRWGGAGAPPGA